MKKEYLIALFRGSVFGYLTFLFIFFNSCTSAVEQKDDFSFFSEQFADIKILRYQVPGFDELNLSQKKLVYYLTQAGLEGRDIMYDQNYRHNVSIRTALEKIYQNYKGNKSLDNWKSFETYLKRIWFSNGIHHHYSEKKIMPDFSKEYFKELVKNTNPVLWPTLLGESLDQMVQKLTPVMFDPNFDNKKVNKKLY